MNLRNIWKFLWKSRLTHSIIILFASILLLTEAEDSLNQPLIIKDDPIQKQDLTNYQNYIDSLNQISIYSQCGIASYYGDRFHNRKTASGLRYNMNKYTGAHRTISFGNIVRITNKSNGLSTLVLINDRGPFIKKRIMDLSRASATKIKGLGIPAVRIETLDIPDDLPDYIKNRLYLAFTINCEPKYVDISQVVLLRQSNDFSEIVGLLHQACENTQGNEFYLFVKASDYGRLSDENIYWLGTVQQAKLLVQDH